MNYIERNKIVNKLNYLKQNGIEFLSGTIAPADSSIETMEIESIKKALDYFQNKDSNIVLTVQPKWMGSRAQLYLFNDSDKESFFVTRNGYKINTNNVKHKDLIKVIDKWKKIFKNVAFKECDHIILDGELMPWAAMGGDLIEREFNGYSISVNNELDFLIENQFQQAVVDYTNSINYTSWMEADDIGKKDNRYHETNKLLNEDNIPKVADMLYAEKRAIDSYNDQVKNYSKQESPYYVPFDILKIVKNNGTVMVDTGWMESTNTKFSLLRHFWDDEVKKQYNLVGFEKFNATFTINDNDKLTYILNKLRIILNSCKFYGMEGFMIKAEYPNNTSAVHTLKVRNDDYLLLIYGHNYNIDNSNLKHMINNKKTGKKRAVSHNEYKLGKEMLKLDKSSPTYDQDYDRIATKILYEIELEKTLDNRL